MVWFSSSETHTSILLLLHTRTYAHEYITIFILQSVPETDNFNSSGVAGAAQGHGGHRGHSPSSTNQHAKKTTLRVNNNDWHSTQL